MVKRFLNKVIVSAMAAVLLATMPVSTVYAEDITVSEDDISYTQNDGLKVRNNYGLRPAKERVVHHDISPDDPALGAADAAESRYVSPYYTEVINQGDTGCCWAIGNTSALEANLNKKYGDKFEFSWKNLAYYAYHKNDVSQNPDMKDYTEYLFRESTFKKGPISEDGRYKKGSGKYTDCVGNNSSYLFAGGNSYMASLLYSKGRCLKEEKGDDAFTADLTKIATDFGNAGVAGPSASDDYRIKDAYIISADRSNMDVIKAMIKEYGAGAICYRSYELNCPYVYNSEKTINSLRKVYSDTQIANHEVTIVGWDDNIDASKFRSASEYANGLPDSSKRERPAGNGAWICINSWGVDAQNTDHGMTYISYYDASLKYGDLAFYDVYKKGDDKATGLWTDNSFAVESHYNPEASVDSLARGLAMKADKDSTLTSFSVFTAEDNASYTLYVYGNPKVEDKGVSMAGNTPLLTQKVSLGMAGIHVIPLDKVIGVRSGQTVLVVLKPEKTIKSFYTLKETYYEPVPAWDEELYLGHLSYASDVSGMSLVERDGRLMKISNGDVYLQLFSNNGVSQDVVTFAGRDFDMDSLGSATASGSDRIADPNPGVVTGGSYSFESGSDRFDIDWTESVPYTGYPHLTFGNQKNNVTPDISVVIKKNGQVLDSSEYKLKFKNNKFVSGYKGKYPEIYVKLSKSCSREASKALRKVPLGFEIRKCDLSKDVNIGGFYLATNRGSDKVTKLYGIREKYSLSPTKYKLSKDGNKGDVIAEIHESGSNAVTITVKGINNCTGSFSKTFDR
ncbi:MAG: hypothetical protein II799_02060 [Lachnospiraceae bacterium]|nr:hypothetical protein [Lachnospiraceae bacterium]